MADFRTFRALRYDTDVAGDADSLIAPPYDVVSDEEREELYARGPFNVSLVDYGPVEEGDDERHNRYTRARDDFQAWRRLDVLKRDRQPRLYVYDQEFVLGGETKRRRAVFGRLRLEEWEKGIVLPHEATGETAKVDRYRLLEATRAHLSPVLALYRAGAASLPQSAVGYMPVFDAKLPDGRHTLYQVDREPGEAFSAALASHKLYVADGHHRYETAIAYRDERRAGAATWTGDEPENFILAALVDAADPGLAVLPTHRLVRLSERTASLVSQLTDLFDVQDAGETSEAGVDALVAKLRKAGANGCAFGAAGLESGKLHILTPRNLDAVIARTPAGRGDAWRRLDVTVLEHAVLPAVAYDGRPESIDYTEDAHEAVEAVAAGRTDVAFLLNPTAVEQVIAVADAGERMPRKSTFFYPKLATGMLFLPLE